MKACGHATRAVRVVPAATVTAPSTSAVSSVRTTPSTTDSDARLYRKGPGQESRLAYLGHLLSENRHGLVVRATTTRGSRAGGMGGWPRHGR
jgi:hypothetical protein